MVVHLPDFHAERVWAGSKQALATAVARIMIELRFMYFSLSLLWFLQPPRAGAK